MAKGRVSQMRKIARARTARRLERDVERERGGKHKPRKGDRHGDAPAAKRRRDEGAAEPPPSESDGYISLASAAEPTPTKKHLAQPDRNERPWLRPVAEYPGSLVQMLHEEILDFVRYMEPTVKETALRQFVVNEITKVAQGLFDNAEVKVFGSYATDLYLPTSDIDVVVMSGSRKFSVHDLRNLARSIRVAGLVESMQVIEKARVPIIKLTDSLLGVRIDISFNVGNGIKTAALIREMVAAQPALKPLTFVVKQFLLQRQLNEVFTGGLSSFSILSMIASFLQMHPLVQAGTIDPMQNLGVLLLEFFELYGLFFNYNRVGISITRGGSYFSKRDRKWTKPNVSAIMLSVEDPHDATNDVSAGSYNLYLVRKSFEHAYRTLTFAIGARQNDTRSTARPVTTLLGLIITLDARSTSFRQVILERFDRLQAEVLSKGLSPFAMVASQQITAGTEQMDGPDMSADAPRKRPREDDDGDDGDDDDDSDDHERFVADDTDDD